MKRPLVFLALTLPLVVSAACKEKPPNPEPSPPTPPATASVAVADAEPEAKAPEIARPFNVLLIMIDSLRADMPWAGYERDILPNLTKYAKESCTVYENGYSFSSYTAKSVVPALVGEYPSAMKRDGYFFTRYPDADNLFLSERAQKEGHRTLAGHAHGYFLPALGNNQGFDDYRLIPGGVDIQAVVSITSERLTKLAIDMLSDEKNVKLDEGKRFFGYFHYMDPHHTYERHKDSPDFGNKARDLYDNEVHHTDKWVHNLLEFARKQPWWKDTAVVITADHGEGFGERNQFRHAYELWEAVVKVPLVFCVPGAAPQHIRDVRRGHIDLAPTLADLMALPMDPPYRGDSLVPEIFGTEKPKPKRIVVDLPRADLMDRRRGVIADDWKIVAFGDDRSFMLFNLAEDPWEKTDLAKDNPEKLEEMKQIYAEESAKIPNVEVTGGPPLKGAPAGRRW